RAARTGPPSHDASRYGAAPSAVLLPAGGGTACRMQAHGEAWVPQLSASEPPGATWIVAADAGATPPISATDSAATAASANLNSLGGTQLDEWPRPDALVGSIDRKPPV